MLAPSPEVRWLRFSSRHPREGERRMVDGAFYVYASGDWHRVVERRSAPEMSRSDLERATALTSMAQKKYDAAPEWQDLIDRFGEQGVVRDEHGVIVQYNYPKYDDPEKNRRIAEEVYDLWEPHRRVEMEMGAEASARHEPVLLKDPDTGQTFSTHPAVAEKRARKRGLVEVRKRRTLKRGGSE